MKFSVNLMTHNGASAFIKDAIRSVYDYTDEIIVCDTGSTDDTLDIVRKFERVFAFSRNVQHLGATWTNSEKDVQLTEILNELKERTIGKWILKIDDDEIFPSKLMEEIVALSPAEQIYSIPFIHIGQETKSAIIKRLFANVPTIRWNGIYGTETLAVQGKRVASDKCPILKNPFLHLGSLRKDFNDRLHGYEQL